MFRKISVILPILIVITLLAPVRAPAVHAIEGLPNYQLQFLGLGSPFAINNTGTVVGAKIVNVSDYVPLVSVGGAPWASLPVLSGAKSVFPTAVNDSGVIVGVSYDQSMNAIAVRWTQQAGVYVVEELPRLPGDNSSYATAFNNLGQVVGARSAFGYTPGLTTGWLYSDELGVVDLFAEYGWDPTPRGINDVGQLIGGTTRLNLNTGLIEVLGGGPPNYYDVTGLYINNTGQVGGYAPMRSSSLNIVSVFRYDNAGSWLYLAGTSQYTMVSSINNLGDVGYGELGAGLYLDGLGVYALWALLDPAVVQAGWAVTGSSPKINDQRMVATTGTNSLTGETGGVLLTPVGTLQPPNAPVNLQGVAHYASWSEPWNSIDLTWENSSQLTNSYELERSETGANTWIGLALVPPPSPYRTSHTDTTVEVGVTYDYRVRAVGLAGPSPWSDIITVTAPTIPLDVTPPTVTILTPADGATLSGIVSVSAQATDNVGVEYLEISFWNQYIGQEVILGSTYGSESLIVNWNTSGLTPATYAVWAYAYDALGNWTQSEISVNVTSSGAQTLRVTSIRLSGTVRGNTANITGTVNVKDDQNKAVANATVAITWTLPNGSTQTATTLTNATGNARFTISGTRGTYTLTVTNVTKVGYIFDAATSVLTKSITK